MAKCKPGDRVLLQTFDLEEFEGTIEEISTKMVNLYAIHYKNTNTDYPGNMYFFREEVRKLVKFTDNSDSEASPDTSENPLKSKTAVKMHLDQYKGLQKMAYDFVFIDTFGAQFDEAVEVLNTREHVGVVGLGSTFSRGNPLSLLVMADSQTVFIFDLVCLVELRQLRNILESKYICKVAHNGIALVDCLYHKYRVDWKNIFDTQAVDSEIAKEQQNIEIRRNLAECLDYHFNLPSSVLLEAMKEPDKFWHTRPILKNDKMRAALLAVYLLRLKKLLIEKIVTKYTSSMNTNYSNYKQMSDTDISNLRID